MGGRSRFAVAAGALALGVALGSGGCGKDAGDPASGDANGFSESWNGALSRTYGTQLDPATSSTKAALQQLHLHVLEESGSLKKRSLNAEGSDGISVTVELAEVARDSTKVSVKVGWLGDADLSRRIHSEIEGEIERRGPGFRGGRFGGGETNP